MVPGFFCTACHTAALACAELRVPWHSEKNLQLALEMLLMARPGEGYKWDPAKHQVQCTPRRGEQDYGPNHWHHPSEKDT